MAFFKEGLSKLMGKGHADAPSPRLRLGEGCFLGPGAVVPQTLTSWNSVIAYCTDAGHVRVFGPEMEVTLKNPAAPLHPEFLLFPRPGLILVIGVSSCAVAPSQAAPSDTGKATWMLQWWELSGSGAAQAVQPVQAAVLRFGVTCVSVAEEACLVFLGTDEGDVRVFDAAGESPHLASYCVPWGTLSRADRPCPVAALSASPEASPELLVATGEGALMLWSFEKHKVARSFDPISAVTSVLWSQKASHFLAATRSDVSLFSRGSGAPLARLALPGGPAQAVELLHWEGEGTNGQLLLRRGAPKPSLLCFSGENWSKVDVLLPDVAGAALLIDATCTPALASEELEAMSSPATSEPLVVAVGLAGALQVVAAGGQSWPATWGSLPLANVSCVQVLPQAVLERAVAPTQERFFALRDGELEAAQATPSENLGTADGWFVCPEPDEPDEADAAQELVHWQLPEAVAELHCELSLGLDAKAELRVDGTVLVFDAAEQRVALVPADAPGEEVEVDLAPGVSHLLQLKLTDDGVMALLLDEVPLALAPLSRPKTMAFRCLHGELRLRNIFEPGHSSSPEPRREIPEPVQLVEAMYAHHAAHFRSFLAGDASGSEPHAVAFAESWNLLAGGCQGLLASGHKDGTVRLWLRGRSSVLLLQVLSLQPRPALPWRPRFDQATEAIPKGYDGVDACPAFCAGEASASSSVSAVVLEPRVAAVAAGSCDGEVVVFLWQTTPQKMSDSEAAEWRVQMLLHASEEDAGVTQEAKDLPCGFACAMRLRQHQASIAVLKVVPFRERLQVFSADASSRICISDCYSGELLFSHTPKQNSPSQGPGPPPETLEAVAFSNCILPGQDQEDGSYVCAFSSGELRQIAGGSAGFKLLDGRIRETRLPQVCGGQVLALQVFPHFLVAAQPNGASVFPREKASLAQASVKFAKRALAAEVGHLAEPCLLALLSTGQLEVFSLPSLQPVASLPVASAASIISAPELLRPAPGGFCSDGYFTLQGAGAMWMCCVEGLACQLDASAKATASAQLVQALQPQASPTEPDQSKPHGLLGALFGRGAQKTLRACTVSTAPPAEVDAERLDRGRGLTPAWRDLRKKPPPPPAPLDRPAAQAAGVRETLNATSALAAERGDKINGLASRSQRMAEDADQFLDLAKQLNARQNRWF
ncbi:unnamed protein product [Effrenium voratum]|uniref:V-SNARE coiled-coil homology domain-containing protein n=1 Tax=Effrenium voratum TaxID=2562239 RepID=A0AA36MIK5_9DINO|nr:unnamed protein product [Effrenium voratum]